MKNRIIVAVVQITPLGGILRGILLADNASRESDLTIAEFDDGSLLPEKPPWPTPNERGS